MTTIEAGRDGHATGAGRADRVLAVAAALAVVALVVLGGLSWLGIGPSIAFDLMAGGIWNCF